jgi:adenylate kinase family enzyme
MKLLIFGAQCSGKTTLVKYLRSKDKLPMVEMDAEVVKLNGGTWPKDITLKEKNIDTVILQQVLAMDNVIFFVNHLTIDQVERFKEEGFTIVVLKVNRSELLRRNQKRIKEEDYDDASKWIEMQLADTKELKKGALIDKVIDGEQPTAVTAKELLALIT